MKRITPNFGSDFDLDKARISRKSLYQAVEEDCNNFLKTKKGIKYLCMKYPNLSLENAIREYKSQVYIATYLS